MDNHEAMHGETVGLFEPFSNGMQAPGEAAGTPTWAAEMRLRANQLRHEGLSYEQIADTLSDERYGTTPWMVYSWCNPEKTGEQIKAWMDKHHPDRDAWVLESLAKHNPEALRRMEEGAQREAAYLKAKGVWPG
jgi:hypothetical protein